MDKSNTNIVRATDVVIVSVISFILTAIYFYNVVFTDKIFADRDMLMVYLPMFRYWAQRVLSGGFPDWYPYDALGEPFIGNVLGSAFHPLKLFFLIFTPGIALKISTLFCFPLASAGFYLLMRSLRTDGKAAAVGAILFAFNGYAVSMTNNFPYLLGMASTPWAFWLTVRLMQSPCFGRAFLAALGYALILFSGETQSFLLACLGGAFIAFVIPDCEGRRRNCFFIYCGTMAMAAALTAVQWVPSLQMMRDAIPGASGSSDLKAATWSMPFLRLPAILAGGLNGSAWYTEKHFAESIYDYNTGGFWTKSVYFGLPGCVLALIALSRKDKFSIFLGASSLFVLLCILGDNLGVYTILHKIPFFTPLRYPEKLFSLWMLLMSMLASLGFAELLRDPAPSGKGWKFLLAGTFISLALAAAESGFGLWSDKLLRALSPDRTPQVILEKVISDVGACASISICMTILCLFSVLLAAAKYPRLLVHTAALTIFLACFFSAPRIYTPAIPEIAENPIEPVQAAMALAASRGSETGPARVLVIKGQISYAMAIRHPELDEEISRLIMLFMFTGNYTANFGVEQNNSYLPGGSKRFMKMVKQAGMKAGIERLAPMFSNQSINVFNRDYAAFGGLRDLVFYEHPELGTLLVQVPDPMPRAYLARPICVNSPEESLSGVLSPDFDFRHEAIVECGAASAAVSGGDDESANSAGLGQAALLKRDPEYVSVEVDSAREGSVLVLTDAFYNGWTAAIDGTPAEILPANHVVRGVMVPKGKHLVEFRYRTPGLIPAALISILTLIAGAIASIILRRRSTRIDSDLTAEISPPAAAP